jgi:Na+-transporting NADH:ubiquinone oxidoreductase subunit F
MKLLVLRKLHRWIALLVGLQFVLWTSSGLVFAWLDHHAVSGEHLTATPAASELDATTPIIDPSVLSRVSGRSLVRSLALQPVDGHWVYRIETDDGVQLRLARDGTRFVVDEARVRRLAASHYRGSGRLVATRFHAGPTLETRDAAATWQADFDDAAGTRLYFSADDGSLAAVRTDAWRLKDIFWMLHTMDYRGRDDFNNPLVMLAGAAAAWVALTGAWLLLRVFRRSATDGPRG